MGCVNYRISFVLYYTVEYKLFVKIKYVLSILLSNLYISPFKNMSYDCLLMKTKKSTQMSEVDPLFFSLSPNGLRYFWYVRIDVGINKPTYVCIYRKK